MTQTPVPYEGLEVAAKWHEAEAEYYEARHGDKDGVPFPIVAGWHRLHAERIRALPHLPLGFEVKQLEWVKHGDRDYQSALTDFGVLYVADAHGWRVLDQWFGVHDIDAAKAAAQADFERRVRECLVAKPVDVAAVRRQAFEDGFENGVEQSLDALNAYDDITRNEADQTIRKLKPDYRVLSARPVQGCGND